MKTIVLSIFCVLSLVFTVCATCLALTGETSNSLWMALFAIKGLFAFGMVSRELILSSKSL